MTALLLSQKYQVDLVTVQKALANLEAGKACFLGVSGKIGAGKDTIAPLLMEELGFSDARHESYASPLRREVDCVIAIIQKSHSLEEAVTVVTQELTATNVRVAVEAIYEVVKNGEITSSYQRTPEVRIALQWWGTEVRRAVDVDYWVKQAVRSSLTLLAEGVSIFVTDMRFPNEVDAVNEFGGYILRLHVSPEEQARRISIRDGKPPAAEAMTHVSETALDDYEFEHLIDTDASAAVTVVAEAAEWIKVSSARLTSA